MRSPTAASLNGRGVTTVPSPRATSASIRPARSPSPGRQPARTSTGRPSKRPTRYRSHSSDGVSPQCRSSITSASGDLALMLTVSQYSPCMTASGRPGAGSSLGSSTGVARRAAPASSAERSAFDDWVRRASNSCRTIPKGNSSSSSSPLARSTSNGSAARFVASVRSRVLPMPGGPWITSSPPSPAAAAAAIASIVATSSERSSVPAVREHARSEIQGSGGQSSGCASVVRDVLPAQA